MTGSGANVRERFGVGRFSPVLVLGGDSFVGEDGFDRMDNGMVSSEALCTSLLRQKRTRNAALT
jgi:hypothetical protein